MKNILILYNLGISENTILNMLEIEPDIKDLREDEINEYIMILKNIGCTDKQIINIIGSNPSYLMRISEDVILLINRLTELGFSTLNILFDSNPYILNLDVFEINNYIDDRLKKGEELEDIVDDLESNTTLFFDM